MLSASVRIAACLLLAGGVAMVSASAPSIAGPVIELPSATCQTIEKYLGTGVVGRAVEAPTIDDPMRFMGGLGTGWFFADGVGPVVRIDRKDVSATLPYRDESKIAEVLVERR